MPRFILVALLAGAQLSAQTSGGVAAPAPVQPATGGGQVGQPPQNSAMRAAGAGAGQPRATARANPMGMAGMGELAEAPNALTLSAGGSDRSGQPTNAGQGGAAANGQDTVRITDTGVTQRMPAGRQGGR